MATRRIGSVLCLAVLLLAAGCGDRTRAALSGTVSLDGSLLKAGTVTVQGENGRVTSTGVDVEGRYNIPDAPVGKVKLAVMTLPVGQDVMPPDTKGVPVKRPPLPAFVPLPACYHQFDTSGLTTTVEPGQTNHFDVQLKK